MEVLNGALALGLSGGAGVIERAGVTHNLEAFFIGRFEQFINFRCAIACSRQATQGVYQIGPSTVSGQAPQGVYHIGLVYARS